MEVVAPAWESPVSPRVAGTYGHMVAKWARDKLGMELGPWQRYAINRMLERDDDWNLLARLALISVARQNGKSVIVRALVGWLIDEGFKYETFADWKFVLFAAHDANQARIPYEFVRRDLLTHSSHRISSWGGTSKVKRGQGPNSIARATLYTGIEFNGVRVDTATRQAGSSRGLSPGLICFDEVLTQTDFETYEVLSPSQSAIRNSQMMMTSTAGFADSVVLRTMYDRLTRQATGAEQYDHKFMGLWWCAPHDDVTPDDYAELEQANPALEDGRLSIDSIRSEYAILPRGSWIRERLNRWSDERVDSPFTLAQWGACRQREPLMPALVSGAYTVAVDVTANWSEGTIVVAAMRTDNRVGVEVHRHLQGRPTAPLTGQDFLIEVERIRSRVRVDAVVYSSSSALAPMMERYSLETGVSCLPIQPGMMMKACDDFAEAVISKRLAVDDPYLDGQVQRSQRRMVGGDGQWRWAISNAPITGTVAMTIGTAWAARGAIPVQVFV